MKESDFTKVPVSKLTAIPDKGGYYELRKNRYWVVTEDNCVLFYKGSPQCNINKSIVDVWQGKREKPIFQNARVEFIENAWTKHECDNYR